MSKKIVHFSITKCHFLLHFVARSFLISLIFFICFVSLLFCLYFVDLSLNKNPSFDLFVIATPSMVPTIKVNDGIIVHRINNDQYKIGDIITFSSSDEKYKGLAVTHRIVDKKIINKDIASVYQTKGDNNARADFALVHTEDIYGKVLFKIPKIGYVQNALSNPIYFVSCFLTVGMIFIFYELYRIVYMLVKRRVV